MLELITGLSIAAVLSLGIAQTTAIVFKDSARYKEALEFDRLVAQIEQRLSGSLAPTSGSTSLPNSRCAKTLGDGAPSPVLTVGPEITINKLYEFAEPVTTVYLSAFDPNRSLTSISIQSMKFTMTGNVPTQNLPPAASGASASFRSTAVGHLTLFVGTKSGRTLSRQIPLIIQYDRTNSRLISCGQTSDLSLLPTMPACTPGQYLIQLPITQSDPTKGSNLDPNIWWCANVT